MIYTNNLPTAGLLMCERNQDQKKFMVVSMKVNGNVTGISSDGERTVLKQGQFRLFRKEEKK